MDYKPIEGNADYRQQFIIDLEKSIIDKNDKIEISGKTAICNFNPVNIECDTTSQKINFFICKNKGQIDDKKMKCSQLGLYAAKIEFEKTDKDDIKKALEAKYKQTLKPNFEKIEVNDKLFELYGMKNLAITIPTFIYRNNKIKAVLYSLPEEAKALITYDKFPVSELSEKNIKVLKTGMNNYKKTVNETIQKVKDEQPNTSKDDIKKLLEQYGMKMNIDNMDEFRSYMANQQMSTWFAYSLKDILESRGLKLNSNILIVTSTKIEKMIVDESINIALEEANQAAKKEEERKANALSF